MKKLAILLSLLMLCVSCSTKENTTQTHSSPPTPIEVSQIDESEAMLTNKELIPNYSFHINERAEQPFVGETIGVWLLDDIDTKTNGSSEDIIELLAKFLGEIKIEGEIRLANDFGNNGTSEQFVFFPNQESLNRLPRYLRDRKIASPEAFFVVFADDIELYHPYNLEFLGEGAPAKVVLSDYHIHYSQRLNYCTATIEHIEYTGLYQQEYEDISLQNIEFKAILTNKANLTNDYIEGSIDVPTNWHGDLQNIFKVGMDAVMDIGYFEYGADKNWFDNLNYDRKMIFGEYSVKLKINEKPEDYIGSPYKYKYSYYIDEKNMVSINFYTNIKSGEAENFYNNIVSSLAYEVFS